MAVDYRELLKARLLDSAGAGAPGSVGGAVDYARQRNWNTFLNSQEGRYLASRGVELAPYFEQKYYGGALPFQWGQRPDDATLNRWMDKVAPGVGQSAPTRGRRGGGSGSQGGKVYQSNPGGQQNPQNALLMQLLDETERARLEAKQANIDKFDRGDRMYQDRNNRVMDEIANWGEAGKIDIADRSRDALNTALARNNASGLGSVNAALIQRNAIDQAREQLRHSENISARKADADSRLTKEHADFIERRDDVPPDLGQVYQLAQLLGQSGGGQGYGTAASQSAPATDTRASGQRPMMTPWGAVQKASYYPGARTPVQDNIFPGNPLDPMSVLAGANAQVQSLLPQRQATGSNAYPVVQSPEFYQMLRSAVRQNASSRNANTLQRNRGRMLNRYNINRQYKPNLNYV